MPIPPNSVGDIGEGSFRLFQRHKACIVEGGGTGAANHGGKFVEGEALGARRKGTDGGVPPPNPCNTEMAQCG